MPSEESFSPEDEAFFQGAGADAADSVRPVTLDGHAALVEEDDAGALAQAPHPGRFVRPVQRVVAVLAAISAVGLMREALLSPADALASAPGQLAANATPASDLGALADDLTCSTAQVALMSEEFDASSALEPGVAFIGPPAPPNPRVKVAKATLRAAPTKGPARKKSLSTAALLHAVRAQHAAAR